MSPNVPNSVNAARVKCSFAIPSAWIHRLVKPILPSTITRHQPIKPIVVLVFATAADLYACGLHPVSSYYYLVFTYRNIVK